MAEWHLTPEYLLDNWTDEQFEAFWDRRNQRHLEEKRAIDRATGSIQSTPSQPDSGRKIVTDMEMFQFMGIGQQGNA